MMMGFGCNAAGVVATRIIDSPRERLIAIITNNFALCNGRWPTQILIATIFIGALAPAAPGGAGLGRGGGGRRAAGRGADVPRVVGALADGAAGRGLDVQPRAAAVPAAADPADALHVARSIARSSCCGARWCSPCPPARPIWLVGQRPHRRPSIAEHLVRLTRPARAASIGLNGVILLAYIVAIPANEIVIPTVLMLTVLTTGRGGRRARARA